jgi:hypothetical protein
MDGAEENGAQMHYLCSYLTSIMIVGTGAQDAHPGPLDARALVAQATAKWAEYKTAASALQGRVTMKVSVSDGTSGFDAIWQFKQNTNCKMQNTEFKQRGAQTLWVRCQNPRYYFELRKKSPEAAWFVSDFQMPKKHGRVETDRLHDLFFVQETPIELLFAQSTFRIVSLAPSQQHGPATFRIEFDNTHRIDKTDRNPCLIQGGTIILDASNYWCLRSANLRSGDIGGDSHSHCQVDCVYEVSSGLPIPTKVTDKRTLPSPKKEGGNLVANMETTHELVRAASLPEDAEFSLSAFGLPEPEGIVWERKPRYNLWLLAGGAVVLLAAFYFSRRRRLSKAEA